MYTRVQIEEKKMVAIAKLDNNNCIDFYGFSKKS